MNKNFELNVLQRSDEHNARKGKMDEVFFLRTKKDLTRHDNDECDAMALESFMKFYVAKLAFMFPQQHIDHGFTIQVFMFKERILCVINT